MKTNGARFLESLGIPFELREYEVDPDDLTAITVAKKIGMPAEQVFKTLLVTGGPDIYRFAVIPGDAELDFKKLARAAGLRKAEMAPLKDVQPLTGYIRGGVTLFGARKPYPVYIDETAILFDQISVSAGARGTQLILSPRRLPARAQALEVEVQTRRPDQRCAIRPRGHRMTRALWTHLVKDLRIELALPRRFRLDALLLAAGGGALFHRLRPARRLLPRHRRRRPLRGHHVRLGQRAQPGMGPRNPPPGHGRAAHGPRARRGTLPGQGYWPIFFSSPSFRSCWRRFSDLL
jgi:Cys-tRNA(Pro)/Cys-tRNA(Cys) deacylase